MRHRGPDAQCARETNIAWADVDLGMSRLKIVDQTDLEVPLSFPYLGIDLAYNGEIYNWRELRNELHDGTPWLTRCDAELLARAWRAWGTSCLQRLNGMFAFILVDHREEAILIARGRCGKKPLYWAQKGGELYLASEAKALPIPLAPQPCRELAVLEFDCLEETPFEGVRQVPPGHAAILRREHSLLYFRESLVSWWSLPGPGETVRSCDTCIEDELQALVTDAVRIRAKAEVPIAVQLSGGLDSAIIQAVARSEHLYTVTFPDDGVDNLELARLAAQGGDPIPVMFGYSDLLEAMPKVAYHLDTPATWTAVCQWFLCRRISEDGIKVVLAGEGADELLGGYTRYRILYWLDRMLADPHLEAYQPTIQHLLGSHTEILSRLLDRSSNGCEKHRALAIVDEHAGTRQQSLASAMARVDFHTTLQVLLRMADRMTAAFGMENRDPFLDYRIVEFCARLPDRYKIGERDSKSVLRRVASRLGVHPAIVGEKTKRGLFLPWARWTRQAPEAGSRGCWDRRSFSELAYSTWLTQVCRSTPL